VIISHGGDHALARVSLLIIGASLLDWACCWLCCRTWIISFIRTQSF